MADTFSTNIKGNVRGREDIDPFEEARDLINQAANQERMQDLEQGFRAAYLPKSGSLANIATSPIETGVRSPQRFNIDPFRDTRLGDTLRNTYGLDETAIRNLQNARTSSGDIDDLGSATPIFKTVGEGRSPVSGNVYDAYTPQGLASIGVDDFTDFAMRTRPFVEIAQPPAPPEGTPNVGQGFDPKNTGVSSTVKGIAELLGYNMDSREGLAEYFRDTALADKAYRDQQEMRNKDRDRALAAAVQNQPIDPCPEGYRLDPMSKVCVPTDDTTTDTAPGTGRVYETMTAPQENYTATSNFTVPTINLPDIFTGK